MDLSSSSVFRQNCFSAMNLAQNKIGINLMDCNFSVDEKGPKVPKRVF